MATRYWVGGGSSTNWNATGNTNWSATSGGANNASVPVSGDDVIFDAASGSGGSVLNTAFSIRTLDMDAFTGTLSGNGALTIEGNDSHAPGGVAFRWGAGMTRTWTGTTTTTFTSTSGTTSIQPNGKGFSVSMTFNGAGGSFVALGGWTSGSAADMNFTAGNWDGGGFNFNMRAFVATGSATRTITLGSGTYTAFRADATPWNFAGTNITLSATGTTIAVAATATSTRTIALGAYNWSGATFNVSDTVLSGYSVTITGGGATLGALNFTNVSRLNLAAGETITWTVQPSFDGNSSIQHYLGGTPTITMNTAIALVFDYLAVNGITKSGAGSITCNNSYDLGGNSGVTINPPASGGSAPFISG